MTISSTLFTPLYKILSVSENNIFIILEGLGVARGFDSLSGDKMWENIDFSSEFEKVFSTPYWYYGNILILRVEKNNYDQLYIALDANSGVELWRREINSYVNEYFIQSLEFNSYNDILLYREKYTDSDIESLYAVNPQTGEFLLLYSGEDTTLRSIDPISENHWLLIFKEKIILISLPSSLNQ